MPDRVKSTGAVALALSGIVASFALAACCALPLLLVGVGLSPYWLAPAADVGVRFGGYLTAFSAVALPAAVLIVLWPRGTCASGTICSRLWFRAAIAALALFGAALFVLSKIYA